MRCMGDLTTNFSRSEFRCPDCKRVELIDAHLLRVLERLRARVGRPLRIVSGWRCCEYNKRVGGIRFSEHLYGRAADIPRGYCRPADAKAVGVHGAGVRDGWVIHVDVEPGRGFYTFAE